MESAETGTESQGSRLASWAPSLFCHPVLSVRYSLGMRRLCHTDLDGP